VSIIMIKNNANLSVIIQLWNLAKRIFNSRTLWDDLDSACQKSGITSILMV
jgi:hypothetical protein